MHIFQKLSCIGGEASSCSLETDQLITLVIESNSFIKNTCYQYGGGGSCLGFVISPKNSNFATNNTVSFTNCTFEENSANGNGGGLVSFQQKAQIPTSNKINIINCQWRNNSAFVASAVDLAPEIFNRWGNGLLPKVVIDNCTFEYNHDVDIIKSESDYTSTQA